MNWGIDTATNLKGKGPCIRSTFIQGVPATFACRYIATDSTLPKVMTRAEAESLAAAGLWIVTIFEDDPTSPRYFSRRRGDEDASAAKSYADDVLGQPSGSPIYFAVDFDAQPSERERIVSYFEGVNAALRATAGTSYATGIYGSTWVLSWIATAHLADFFWQSMPPAWSGGQNRQVSRHANLRQHPARLLCGVVADVDESWGHGGGWRLQPRDGPAASIPH